MLQISDPITPQTISSEQMHRQTAIALLERFERMESVREKDGYYRLYGLEEGGRRVLLQWLRV